MDFAGYDLIVLVKRPAGGQIEALNRSGIPWVWDVVDFYPQPQCSKWSRLKSIDWVKAQIDAFSPNGVVWPNERMAKDCGTEQRDLVLYHHYRPSLSPRTVRDDIQVVGYEGSPRYLGRWGDELRKICKRRGWTFRTEGTPEDFDVCVAFRDDSFNGYAQKHWKSNVKLANCHGSGTPFIGAGENGYLECATGKEVFCDDVLELGACLDMLRPKKVREDIQRTFLANRYSLSQAADTLKTFLMSVS